MKKYLNISYLLFLILWLNNNNFSYSQTLTFLSEYGNYIDTEYDFSGTKQTKAFFPSKTLLYDDKNYFFYNYEYTNLVNQNRNSKPYLTSKSYTRREGIAVKPIDKIRIYSSHSKSSFFFNWFDIEDYSHLTSPTTGNSLSISGDITKNLSLGIGSFNSKTVTTGTSKYFTKNMTFFKNEPQINNIVNLEFNFFDIEYKIKKFTFYFKSEKRKDYFSLMFYDSDQNLSLAFKPKSNPKLFYLDYKINNKITLGISSNNLSISDRFFIKHYYPAINANGNIGIINISSQIRGFSPTIIYKKTLNNIFELTYKKGCFDFDGSGRLVLDSLIGGFFQIFAVGGEIVNFQNKLKINNDTFLVNWKKKVTQNTTSTLSFKLTSAKPIGTFSNALFAFSGLIGPIDSNFKNLPYKSIKVYNISSSLKKNFKSFTFTYKISQTVPIVKKKAKTTPTIGEEEVTEKMKKTTQGGRTHNFELTYFF